MSAWAKPGAPINQFTGGVEMPGMAPCLFDHMQSNPPHIGDFNNDVGLS